MAIRIVKAGSHFALLDAAPGVFRVLRSRFDAHPGSLAVALLASLRFCGWG